MHFQCMCVCLKSAAWSHVHCYLFCHPIKIQNNKVSLPVPHCVHGIEPLLGHTRSDTDVTWPYSYSSAPVRSWQMNVAHVWQGHDWTYFYLMLHLYCPRISRQKSLLHTSPSYSKFDQRRARTLPRGWRAGVRGVYLQGHFCFTRERIACCHILRMNIFLSRGWGAVCKRIMESIFQTDRS